MEDKKERRILKYSELITIPDFDGRLNYLKLYGFVGDLKFGPNRWINQKFYESREWLSFRNFIIVRDNGMDMALDGFPCNKIYIHHLNPINLEDFQNSSEALLDPENLVCVSFETHQSIHYTKKNDIGLNPERFLNDTCPWRCTK